jgi:hypothetical protein
MSRTTFWMVIFGVAIVSVAWSTGVNAGQLRDPMRPGTAAGAGRAARHHGPGATTALQLQAIMGTDAARLAIVSGKVVREGEVVAGARIVLIGAKTVTYQRKRQHGVLRLPIAATGRFKE